MNLFLRKTGLFISLVFALLVLIFFTNVLLLHFSKIFYLDKKVNILILGDSRTKYSLTDKILSGSYNFSNIADSYFYSYQKLKMIAKKNPQIKTLLLSFSQHNIEKSNDKNWLLNSSYLSERNQYYYPMMNPEDFFFLLKIRHVGMLEDLFSQVLYPFKLRKGNKIYGGYADLDHIRLQKAIEKYKNNSEGKEKFEESEVEKHYLRKIYSFCHDHGIKLIFINTPLHKTLFNQHENLDKFYIMNYPDVPFLDFSEMLLSDSCFGDLVHLTPEGAQYLSHFIESKGINKLIGDLPGHIMIKERF